jgi:very-short-patch-repair endonuclease
LLRDVNGVKMSKVEKTRRRVRGNSEVTVRAAYRLRQEETPAERILWSAIRNNEVVNNLPVVLARIREALEKRTP